MQKERQEDLKTSVEGAIHPNSSAVFKLMEKEEPVGVLGPAGALERRSRTQHKTFNDIFNPRKSKKTKEKTANFSTCSLFA